MISLLKIVVLLLNGLSLSYRQHELCAWLDFPLYLLQESLGLNLYPTHSKYIKLHGCIFPSFLKLILFKKSTLWWTWFFKRSDRSMRHRQSDVKKVGKCFYSMENCPGSRHSVHLSWAGRGQKVLFRGQHNCRRESYKSPQNKLDLPSPKQFFQQLICQEILSLLASKSF